MVHAAGGRILVDAARLASIVVLSAHTRYAPHGTGAAPP
jgi:cysteine sulfinate desulfinase/cysteine desulfurase-like protein